MRRTLLTALVTLVVALPLTALAVGGGGASPATGRALTVPAAPRPGASTQERIRVLQATVRAAPRRADGWTMLAGAYLQRVRETGDAGLLTRADGVLRRALQVDPADTAALTARASLELTRHDFRAGAADARRARALAPAVVKPFGVLVDALVELGRYREAARALQTMVDRRPDLAAYARVSYLRELHGDLAGAVQAMRLAVSAGGDVPENEAYVRSLLGGLELERGRIGAAGRAYRTALVALPGHVPAQAGLAQVEAARGRLPAAIARMRRVVARLPLPQYVTTLAELELAAGRRAAARSDLELVRAEQRLLGRAGVNTDAEAALLEADHGDARRAVLLARRAWTAAPSVRSADALGWALTSAGRAPAALPWARRALALGSRDPLLRFHAGMTARAAGEWRLARSRLGVALAGRAALGPWRTRLAYEALR